MVWCSAGGSTCSWRALAHTTATLFLSILSVTFRHGTLGSMDLWSDAVWCFLPGPKCGFFVPACQLTALRAHYTKYNGSNKELVLGLGLCLEILFGPLHATPLWHQRTLLDISDLSLAWPKVQLCLARLPTDRSPKPLY